MRSDNGPPGGSRAMGGLSRLAVRLIKAGVMPGADRTRQPPGERPARAAASDAQSGDGEPAARNRRILEMRILKAMEDMVRERLLRENRERLNSLLDSALDRELDPYTAARRLLRLSEGACRPIPGSSSDPTVPAVASQEQEE